MTTEATNLESRALNWRRVTRHPALMEYRRLALLVALVNLGVFAMGLREGRWLSGNEYALSLIADMALINLSIGILIRQQRVVNALFWLATRVPTSWPLWIRWGAGKVFHFGGLHSGCTVAGTIWFGFLLFGMVSNCVVARPFVQPSNTGIVIANSQAARVSLPML